MTTLQDTYRQMLSENHERNDVSVQRMLDELEDQRMENNWSYVQLHENAKQWFRKMIYGKPMTTRDRDILSVVLSRIAELVK